MNINQIIFFICLISSYITTDPFASLIKIFTFDNAISKKSQERPQNIRIHKLCKKYEQNMHKIDVSEYTIESKILKQQQTFIRTN